MSATEREWRSAWQCEEARCGVALREVFAWLGGAELARAGAVCRAWRRAAAEPALWRRLLLRRVAPAATRYLSHNIDKCEWRSEYVRACAAWLLCGSECAGGAALTHAALSPCGARLALAADDAAVSVWERAPPPLRWHERWRRDLRDEHGWASAARLQWASTGRRLLVAGPRALADLASSWELLVLQLDEERGLRVASRARCSAGAAGCWASAAGDAFLSLLTSWLAPGVACTAVWLNAATQETQSEFTGVTTRLLRVYNEDNANILHALVLEVPWSALDEPLAADDDAAYYRATRPPRAARTSSPDTQLQEGEWSQLRVLVLASDGGRGAGGAGGAGGRLCAWALGAPQPPPLHAGAAGSLRARYLAHRERVRAPPPDPPAPQEHEVRALCTVPEADCALPATPLGLAPHPGGRCLWVSTADGQALCVSVPALVPLRSLAPPGPRSPGLPAPLHYAQPAASVHHVAACGGGGGAVCVWAALGEARARLVGRHGAPVMAVLLPRADPPCMLVLAGDSFHEWRSGATPQSLPSWW